MGGWKLKEGKLICEDVSDDEFWSIFNYVFSPSCAKANTYKFGFLKSILDNVFNGIEVPGGLFISYTDLFEKFAANYWCLVAKYNLKQTIPNSKYKYSRLESILIGSVRENPLLSDLDFSSINEDKRREIVSQVKKDCSRYVIGALYADFQGKVYSFDLKGEGIIVSRRAAEFMMKYKPEIEKLNYYSWAKFLEKINGEDVTNGLLNKLELATPRRNDLSIYREILRLEFEENNCFYCGRKLGRNIHVDHFIPWSFMKNDKLWNFVLACPSCNEKKSDKLPSHQLIDKIEERNKQIEVENETLHDKVVTQDFENYQFGMIKRLWMYARLGGFIEYNR